MARRQRHKLFAPGIEDRIGADDERTGSQSRQGREHSVDFLFGGGFAPTITW